MAVTRESLVSEQGGTVFLGVLAVSRGIICFVVFVLFIFVDICCYLFLGERVGPVHPLLDKVFERLGS